MKQLRSSVLKIPGGYDNRVHQAGLVHPGLHARNPRLATSQVVLASIQVVSRTPNHAAGLGVGDGPADNVGLCDHGDARFGPPVIFTEEDTNLGAVGAECQFSVVVIEGALGGGIILQSS